MQEEITRAELMEQLDSREKLLETTRQLRADLDLIIEQVDEDRMLQPGSFGPWSFKDLLAHLNGWRMVSALRLEAGLSDEGPEFPWPDGLDESDGPDEINAWLYVTNRDKPIETVLAESTDTFDRIERALAELPKEDLFDPDRFPWLHGYTLGPGVISGMYFHYYQDHEPDIRAWLERG